MKLSCSSMSISIFLQPSWNFAFGQPLIFCHVFFIFLNNLMWNWWLLYSPGPCQELHCCMCVPTGILAAEKRRLTPSKRRLTSSIGNMTCIDRIAGVLWHCCPGSWSMSRICQAEGLLLAYSCHCCSTAGLPQHCCKQSRNVRFWHLTQTFMAADAWIMPDSLEAITFSSMNLVKLLFLSLSAGRFKIFRTLLFLDCWF